MLEAFRSQVARILGQPEDPLGLITPEQLKAVLKSIEGKYNTLRDENKRLRSTLAETREQAERLDADLAAAQAAKDDPDEDPRLIEAKSGLAAAEIALEAREGLVAELRAEIARGEVELRLSHDVCEGLRGELDASHEEVKARDARREAALIELEAEREEHAQTRRSLEATRKDLAVAQQAGETWQRELHEARQDSARLLDDLSTASLTLEAAQSECAQLHLALEQAMRDQETAAQEALLAQETAAAQALQAQETAAAQALQAQETARERIAYLEAEIEGFATKAVSPFTHSALMAERDTLRGELATAQTRLREEQGVNQALREELGHSRHSTQVIATATDFKVMERVSALENEKTELRNQLEAAHGEADRLRRELNGAFGSAFRPGASGNTPQPAPRASASADDRRKMLTQLIRGQNSP